MPADADDTGTEIVETLRADGIAAPVLRRFHAYWDGKRNGRAMPTRADIDPLEFVWALGMVSLIDVLPGENFRFRVDGTRTAEVFGADMTMRTLDDYPDAARRERIRTVLGRAAREAAPLHWRRVAKIGTTAGASKASCCLSRTGIPAAKLALWPRCWRPNPARLPGWTSPKAPTRSN